MVANPSPLDVQAPDPSALDAGIRARATTMLTTVVPRLLRVVPDRPSEVLTLAGMVVIYVVLGLFSQRLNDAGGGLAVVWFPSGLAVLLIGRPQRWPAIFVGSIIADAAVGTPLLSLVLIGTGNSVEALIVAMLLRTVRPDLTTAGVPGFRALLAAALIAPIPSAAIGLGGLLLTGSIVNAATLPTAALTWWLGDMSGILLVGPAVLALRARSYRAAPRRRRLELEVLLASTTVLAIACLSDLLLHTPLAASRAFLLVPVAGFVAIRYGTGAVAAMMALGAGLAALLLAMGQGPFASSDPLVASTTLGAYFFAVATGGFGLAAALHDTRRATEVARSAISDRHRLASAVEQAPVAVMLTDETGRISYASPAARRLTGWGAGDIVDEPPAWPFQPDSTVAASMAANIARLEPWAGPIVAHARDGSTLEIEASLSPIRDVNGAFTGTAYIAMDRTAERRMARDLDVEARMRLAFAEALQHVPADATIDVAADALAAVLRPAAGVDFVAIMGFIQDDRLIRIALSVDQLTPNAPRTASVSSRSIAIHAQSAHGAWFERWSPRPDDGPWASALTAVGVLAVGYAPIRHGGHVDGVLALGTRDPKVATTLGRLVEIVDLTTTPSAMLGDRLHLRVTEFAIRETLEQVIAERAFHAVYQPIVDLETREVIGFEALTRFDSGQRPDLVFADAWGVGLGIELELATLDAALDGSRRLPGGRWLTLNVSPRTIHHGGLGERLERSKRPLVLEVTEHDIVEDYAALRSAILELGPGVRLAVDDAGAGVANFNHLVEMRPDFVKMDTSLVRGIDANIGRQAAAVAMREFARASGCRLIAEGIETQSELDTLRERGVEYGQGFLLGRPARADTWARRVARGAAVA